jgi:hypothetical protein
VDRTPYEPYVITGKAADYIADNYWPCKDLLPSPEKLWAIDWTNWQDDPGTWRIVSNTIEVMRHLAYGYEPWYREQAISPIEQRMRRNPYCYAVAVNQAKPTQLKLALPSSKIISIDFGPIAGFSSINPLTSDGFEKYLNGGYTLSTVPVDAMPSEKTTFHSVNHLFISGVLYLPNILPPFGHQALGKAGEAEFVRTQLGGVAIRCMAEHLGRLLPPVRWDDTTRQPELLDSQGRGSAEFPLIMCPLTQRFMGSRIIPRLGFVRPETGSALHFEDSGNFELYVFDPMRIEQLDETTQRSARQFIRAIGATQDHA